MNSMPIRIMTLRGPRAWLLRQFDLLQVRMMIRSAEKDRIYLEDEIRRAKRLPQALAQLERDIDTLNAREAKLRT